MFDEIVAFTFGHELAHHYMGHTGCANGQGAGAGPAMGLLGRLITSPGGAFNQPNEIVADSKGCETTLAAGRQPGPQGHRWTEGGDLWRPGFFAPLDRASRPHPLLDF